MAHIHTNPGEHDLTASAFIIRHDFPEPRLMLHMHRKLRVLLQPGGHVELNEDPWQAIEHELKEETGYTFKELEVLQPKDQLKSITHAKLHPMPVVLNTHDFDSAGTHKHTDISYAFIAHNAPEGSPEEGESKDVRWLSGEALSQLSNTEIFENVREIGQYVLQHVYQEWEPVSLA
jgi:8-oxo-dGTP pyrophosphatase MutT (NUDIX family)